MFVQKLLLAGRPPKIDLAQETIRHQNGQFDIRLHSVSPIELRSWNLTEAAQTGLELCRHAERKMVLLSFELRRSGNLLEATPTDSWLGFPGVALRRCNDWATTECCPSLH